MSEPQQPQENWQGLNIKGGTNDIHDNAFNQNHSGPGDNVAGDKNVTVQPTTQQGNVFNDQAQGHFYGPVNQYFVPPPLEPTIDGPPNNLTKYGLSPDRFVGRAEDLAAIHDHFAQEPRLVIAGLGGLGKSALALEYGLRHLAADYRGGAGWFEAGNLAAQLSAWMQDNFGLNFERDDRRQIAEGWRKWQEFCGPQRQALVIIDGVDPARYAETIAPYLPPETDDSPFRLLVTARSTLGWPQQATRSLAPLGLAEMGDWLAAALPADRLAADPQATAALLDRLGGWPLALKIAIATLQLDPHLMIAQLLAEIDAALTEPPPTAAAPRGLWASLQASWDRLDADSQALARLLSLFGPTAIPWDWVADLIAQGPAPLPASPPPPRRKRDRLWSMLTGQPTAPTAPAPAPPPPIAHPLMARGRLLDACVIAPANLSNHYQIHSLVQEFAGRDWPAAERDRWAATLGTVAANWAATIPKQPDWEQVQALRLCLPHAQAATAHLERLLANQADSAIQQQLKATQKAINYPLVRLSLLPAFEATFRKARQTHDQARKTGNLDTFKDALAGYRRALDQLREALPADSRQRAGYLHELANCLKDMGDYRTGVIAAAEAVAIVDHPDSNRSLVARYLNTLGTLYDHSGELAKAEPILLRSLEITEQVLGADHPNTAASLNNLALLYESQGRYEAAEPLFRRSLDIWERVLGADHPDTASSLNNLANLYQFQGRYEAAEPLLRRSLEIREQSLRADHPATANSLNNLAALYNSQGRHEAAEPLFRRSLEICEQSLGADHPATATSLNNLAKLYYSQGRYEAAEPLLRRSLEIREQSLGADHPDTANSLNDLANLYQSQGRYEAAEPLYLRCLAILPAKLGQDHPNTKAGFSNFRIFVQTVLEADRAADLSDHPLTQSILQQLQNP
jgi:tetratricopeptide (TPR) repeat protein